jgi:hypothetical protein
MKDPLIEHFWHKFDPDEYEKEIYLIKLVDGSETYGYPNAGKMTDMVNGGQLPEDKMEKVKILEDGWEILMNLPKKAK